MEEEENRMTDDTLEIEAMKAAGERVLGKPCSHGLKDCPLASMSRSVVAGLAAADLVPNLAGVLERIKSGPGVPILGEAERAAAEVGEHHAGIFVVVHDVLHDRVIPSRVKAPTPREQDGN